MEEDAEGGVLHHEGRRCTGNRFCKKKKRTAAWRDADEERVLGVSIASFKPTTAAPPDYA